jgi:O-antigen ligase
MPDSMRDFHWLAPSALVAAALPSLLAFNVAPSATFLNQALAVLCWGLLALATAHALPLNPEAGRRALRAVVAPAAALLLTLLMAAAAAWVGGLPRPLATSAAGILLAAAVLLAAGAWAAAAGRDRAPRIFALFCLGWLLAGLLNSVIAAVQVFAPQWADGDWIARSTLAGRAIGNLRQPNHLCTLLLWALIAAMALRELRVLSVRAHAVAVPCLIVALVLTASRTAVVGVALLALFGLADRRLSRPLRIWLLLMPVLYGVAWAAMALWSSWSQEVFGGQQRLVEADLSASRFAIWADTLGLVAAHPWLGVGFGQFNFAWSLTPFPQRPPAFFDHAHNLFLQWAVELGLPAALALTAALGLALWRIAAWAWRETDHASATAARMSLVMLLLVALHSQLEYPLWYAYFLLPTAWLLGFGLAGAAASPSGVNRRLGTGATARGARAALAAAGVALAIGSVLAVADYTRVAVIFDSGSTRPLSERIVQGQRSWLFAHHADYAAATVNPQPEQEMEAFGRASHYLLDTRLMTAWADAFAARGELDRAQHLAARLREFRNPQSADYFEVCKQPAPPSAAAPYQCQSPSGAPLDWRDFLQRAPGSSGASATQ